MHQFRTHEIALYYAGGIFGQIVRIHALLPRSENGHPCYATIPDMSQGDPCGVSARYLLPLPDTSFELQLAHFLEFLAQLPHDLTCHPDWGARETLQLHGHGQLATIRRILVRDVWVALVGGSVLPSVEEECFRRACTFLAAKIRYIFS